MEIKAKVPNDFFYQGRYVASQLRRMLAMQDPNPVSPTQGSFHYAYWRDKTSEFADARFQEAGATFALMLLPEIRKAFQIEIPTEQLKERLASAVRFLESIQHADGSFDEWYKHEHGFAATEFTSVAFGSAALLTQKYWTPETRAIFSRVGTKAGRWLLKHEDIVKANHEMAAAAALAVLGTVLEKPEFLQGARKKFEIALTLRNPEGWFNEIAGMDLGYCSVLLDYAMLYHSLTGDERVPKEMTKLFCFMFPFIHPDLTISAEAGLCLNPYVSRLGALLLSEHCGEAAWFARKLTEQEVGFEGVSPYLSDDLRLCRWSYLPLLTFALGLKKNLITEEGTLVSKLAPISPPLGITHAKEAGIVAYRSENLHAVFLPAGGGHVKIYEKQNDGWKIHEDPGRIHRLPNGTNLCGTGYDRDRKLKVFENAFEVEVPMHPATFFFPGLLPRLVLRILGAVPGLSVWLRRGIDFYRKRNKTALNQSAAPVSKAGAALVLIRTVEFSEKSVSVKDRFEGREAQTMSSFSTVVGTR